MRIATFNILSGRSPVDGRVDVARFGRAIRTLDADILGLQEVDRNQPRSQHADLTAVAAEAMGATHHVFVAALSGSPETDGPPRPATSRPAGRRTASHSSAGTTCSDGASYAYPERRSRYRAASRAACCPPWCVTSRAWRSWPSWRPHGVGWRS